MAPLVRGSLPPGHQNCLLGNCCCYFFGAMAFSRLGLGSSALSWGTQEAFWASTSCPNCVHLPILPPTSILLSQLGLKFGLNLPSNMIFSRMSDPPNLDFCNTLHGFPWFFNISTYRVKDASQPPKYLPNSTKIPQQYCQEPLLLLRAL